MATRRFVLTTILGLCALSFAGPVVAAGNAVLPSGPAVAIFYSFETTPSEDAMLQMKQELYRILAPSGMHLVWRQINENQGNETFPEVLVLRFRGSCEMSAPMINGELGPESAVHELAETQRSEGRMLPFGEVECDQLRRYLIPTVSSDRPVVRNMIFGRAMARVVAHEMFHMLIGATVHAKQGIFRAAHSRDDLTAKTFDFGRPELAKLKDWADRSARILPALTTESSDASGSVDSDR